MIQGKNIIHRGDVFTANLGKQNGAVESGIRPVLIIQNEEGNQKGHTVVVAPLTTQIRKPHSPVHEILPKGDGLEEDSMILCEQITTIDKAQLDAFVCHVNEETMERVTKAVRTSTGDLLIPRLPDAYTEESYQMVMTLCYSHLHEYLMDPIYRIRRLDRCQDKEVCTLCNRLGYDYKITNIRAKQKQMAKERQLVHSSKA